MMETINGKAYVKKGDKVYEVGGGSNIITADSVEQLPDPASVPEGTIALVKSEGESGLPVVELSTTPTAEGVALTADEKALVNAIGRNAFVMAFAGLGYYASCVMTPMWVDGVDVAVYTGVWAPPGAGTATVNFMLELGEDMQSWSFYLFQ